MPNLTTFDQIKAEINASDYIIAKTIRQQMDVRDDRATQIINAYGPAEAGNVEAETVLLQMYNGWRNAYASVVASVAANLGHPVPDGVDGAGTPETPAGFWMPSAGTATEAASEAGEPAAAPEPTPSAPPPTAAAPEPQNGRKTRKAWSQLDIVKLTTDLLRAKPADHDAIIAAIAATLDREPAEVRSKAVELQLVAPPPAAAKYDLSDGDKKVLRTRLLAVVVDTLPLEAKIAQFKYCAAELREIVKSLSE